MWVANTPSVPESLSSRGSSYHRVGSPPALRWVRFLGAVWAEGAERTAIETGRTGRPTRQNATSFHALPVSRSIFPGLISVMSAVRVWLDFYRLFRCLPYRSAPRRQRNLKTGIPTHLPEGMPVGLIVGCLPQERIQPPHLDRIKYHDRNESDVVSSHPETAYLDPRSGRSKAGEAQ